MLILPPQRTGLVDSLEFSFFINMCKEKTMGQIYGIYSKIENRIIYIGQTIIGFEKRFKKHLIQSESNNRYAIHNKIRKYGHENFYPIALEECENDDLNVNEIKFIKAYDTYKNGLNETIGGAAMSGYKHKDETKKIIGEKLKHRWKNDRETIIESLKKRPPRIQTGNELEWRKQYLTKNNPMFSENTKKKLSKTCKDKYDNGYVNPRTQNWKLTFFNGKIVEVFDLKKYCQENNLKYTSLYSSFKRNTKHKDITKIEKVQ